MPARAKPWLGPALLAALVLAAAVFAQSAAGQSLLRSTGLAPAPERYTEMAFDQPMGLPDRLRGGQQTTAPFRLANREGEPRRYDWTVVQHRDRGPGTRLLRSGESWLPDGATKLEKPRITPVCDTPRARIEVRVKRPAQSIDYWVRCLPPKTPAP